MNRKILLATALLLLGQPAFGQSLTNRYVSVSGFDTNNSCISQVQPCRTIQRAINVADSGDTIVIFEGVYTGAVSILAKSLAFTRHESANRPIIQAAEQPGAVNTRTVTIFGPPSGSTTVSFFGLLIRHGKANGSGNNGNGGGIFCIQNCILDVQNTFIRSNVAEGEGGGIYIAGSSGESNFRNVTIEDNDAGTHGGGIRVVNSDLRLHGNTRVHRNTAGGVGGGISMNDAEGTFTNATIGGSNTGDGNVAASHGGGIRATNSNLTLRDVSIRGNISDNRGGGINSNGTLLQAIDSEFILNHAGISGGGVYQIGNRTAFLTRVDFLENRAESNGGGLVAVDGGRAKLRDTVFQGNSAGNDGGGFWNNHDETVLVDVIFGTCGEGSGCMYNSDSSPTLIDVQFNSNNGTGMVNDNNSAPVLTGGAFVFNLQGMRNINSQPVLRNVIFFDNRLRGIENTNSLVTIVNGAISENGHDIPGTGGGILNTESSVTTLHNSTIAGNKGSSSGGGIANLNSSEAVLINSIVWGNTAGDGNEIFNNPDSETSLEYSIFGNGEGDVVSGGGFTAINSLTDDPLFVNAGTGDLRLGAGSPAINAGDPDTDPGLFPTLNGIAIDLEEGPRFSGVIDIGAYESPLSPTIFQDRFEQ